MSLKEKCTLWALPFLPAVVVCAGTMNFIPAVLGTAVGLGFLALGYWGDDGGSG